MGAGLVARRCRRKIVHPPTSMPIMTIIIRAMPASMIGEFLSINTADRATASGPWILDLQRRVLVAPLLLDDLDDLARPGGPAPRPGPTPYQHEHEQAQRPGQHQNDSDDVDVQA
jgi:hypothetical protein